MTSRPQCPTSIPRWRTHPAGATDWSRRAASGCSGILRGKAGTLAECTVETLTAATNVLPPILPLEILDVTIHQPANQRYNTVGGIERAGAALFDEAPIVMNGLSMRTAKDRGEDDNSSIRLVEPIGNRPIRSAGPVLPWLIGFAALLASMLVGLFQLAHIQNG